MLNIFQLYPLLQKHTTLSEKRSPLFFQGRIAKFMSYFMMCFVAIYLMGFSILFALAATDLKSLTAYEFMYSFTPFIFTIDFCVRFTFQQTPLQQVKPYVLLPISKYTCIDFFIIRSLITKGNLIWMFMFVPFAVMAIIFAEGALLTILFLLGFYLIELIVSQLYSIIRTLVNKNFFWWIVVLPIICIIYFPVFFDKNWNITIDFDHLIKAYSQLGNWICNGNTIAWGGLLAILGVAVYANRMLQHEAVYKELAREEKSIKVDSKLRFKFLGKLGLTGEFIKLEIISIRRNKNVRKIFISANLFVLVLSLLCSFTSAYDEMGMIKFWIIYNFAIYGIMMLLRIMTFEGNYIERLMMGHSTIESLLKAKFYIYSVILIFPFVLMLPMFFTGKVSFLMLISFMVYTAGVDNFLFMQLAVYNTQTAPLNQKITGKTMVENSWVIIIIEILAFALPIILTRFLCFFSCENTTYILLTLIGTIFIITHKIWIRNIYDRLNARKYSNIESMIATRN